MRIESLVKETVELQGFRVVSVQKTPIKIGNV